MKILKTTAIALTVIASCFASLASADRFVINNTANFKLSIIAHARNGDQRTWYCPRYQVCHIDHVPPRFHRLFIKKYSDADLHSVVHGPLNHARIKCVKRHGSLNCFKI